MVIAVRNMDSLEGLAFLFLFIGAPGIVAFILFGLFENQVQQKGQTEEVESNSLPTQQQQLSSEPFPGIAQAVGRLHKRLAEEGISLVGCYGYEKSQDGARHVVDHLCTVRPPRYFSVLTEWEMSMYDETTARFSKDAMTHVQQMTDALSHGNEDAALEASSLLFNSFPMQANEEWEAYLQRLMATLRNIVGDSK